MIVPLRCGLVQNQKRKKSCEFGIFSSKNMGGRIACPVGESWKFVDWGGAAEAGELNSRQTSVSY